MKATIRPYQSGPHKGHLIVLTDDDGKVFEKIAMTEVVLEGNPWVSAHAGDGNAVVVRAGGA